MNDTQLLDRLSAAYATVEAPEPSATLAELLESGGVGRAHADDEPRDAVVVPLVPRTRVRMRHLVAATVATFVLFSGLAVAGALPDPVQRQVSSVVSHLGIDLPSPGSGSDRAPDAPRAPQHPQPTATSTPVPTTVADGSVDAAASGDAAPGAQVTTTPGLPLGELGAVADGTTTTPTTLPPSGDGLLPPLTVPQLTVPPLTVAQLPLPLDLPVLGL